MRPIARKCPTLRRHAAAAGRLCVDGARFAVEFSLLAGVHRPIRSNGGRIAARISSTASRNSAGFPIQNEIAKRHFEME